MGTDCPSNGANKCSDCNDGYFLDGAACTLKQCSCTNGSGATGTDCESNGAQKCSGCDNGYYLDGAACTMKQCSCTNAVTY